MARAPAARAAAGSRILRVLTGATLLKSVTMQSPTRQFTAPQRLRLAVSIPALNEEATLAQVIEAIPESIDGIEEILVIVIDDGSTDRTAEIALECGAHLIKHEQTYGVGRAFHSALAAATELGVDLLATIDADGQFDPGDLPKLVAPIVEGRADFVTASRFADPQLVPTMPWIKRWGNRQMSRLISRLTRQTFHDVSCGMRCYNRAAMLNLNLMGAFTYTQEVFLNLAFKNMRLVEVPVVVRGQREHGESRVASSILRYGFHTSRIIFKAYRDYRPLHFFALLALLMFVPALCLGTFQLLHYFIGFHGAQRYTFSPHKWSGISSIVLFVFGFIFLHMGVLGDMLSRHRMYLEELLVRVRTQTPTVETGTDDPADRAEEEAADEYAG
ncbi:MAG: glycosyltransferase family 2 protein [Planctomycetota bacterium]|nr:MAG: glycosyltransferase family 2 protein [Planctomycetota bacterium]